MRTTLLLILLLLRPQVPPAHSLRDAVALGQTHDDALFAAFEKSYALSPSGTLEHAEIITEFRRAVLLVREHVVNGDYSFREASLTKALVPYKGMVTLVARVRLHPLNTLTKEPPYDLYISSGPRSAPIASKVLKRDSIHAPGTMGGPLAAVRLEGSFPRAAIDAAAAPAMVVTDDKAEIVWQARLDLSRYR